LNKIERCDSFDDINSAVCRCIEYNWPERLTLLLSKMDHLIYKSSNKDKRLMLRRININCYLSAKQYGFVDTEWEKRIVLTQRLFRKQSPNSLVYTGPHFKDYLPEMYWGYRNSLYFLRWNRFQRYLILKKIKESWHGDCNYSAYCDYVEGGIDDNIETLI
jgi:hypothetical protein